MDRRIVEIAEDGAYLCKERGHLCVRREGETAGRVPLDDIGVVLASARGPTCTNVLLLALAERSVPFVVCDAGYRPKAVLTPVETHVEQAARLDAQMAAGLPLKKRVWAQLVRGKIAMQAFVLEEAGLDASPVACFVQRVRSGDAGGAEAQAARRYWPLAFGSGFRRHREGGGLNHLLNFGYAVLRGAASRAVFCAGLNPGLGVFHRSGRDALRLADDLMEPFRPVVDRVVLALGRAGHERLTRGAKQALAESVSQRLRSGRGASPVHACLMTLASSLADAYLGRRKGVRVPGAPLPLAVEIPAPDDG